MKRIVNHLDNWESVIVIMAIPLMAFELWKVATHVVIPLAQIYLTMNHIESSLSQ
jgi:hypothetical protein